MLLNFGFKQNYNKTFQTKSLLTDRKVFVAHKNKIRLGLMPPLSGIVSMYGNDITWAGKIAVEEINSKGGVLGSEIELVVLDDGSLPDSSVLAANRLIDEYGCVAIIGNLLSNSRIAVANLVAEPRKVPYLNFSFYEGSISGRYFFSFSALPNQQIEKMIPYMVDRFGAKVFFAGNNYEWPRGSIDAAKRVLLKCGGEIIGEEYLPIGTTHEEIENLLEMVSNSGADIFVPYFAGSDQISLLNRFSELGLKKKIAVVMGHYDEAMVSLLKPEVREGFFSVNTYFMSLKNSKNDDYMKKLALQKGVRGIHPNGNGVLTNFGEGTYVCVCAFAKALKLAGEVEREKIVDALESISVDAPQGVVSMDAQTHHAIVNSYLAQCQSDGRFAIIKDFGQIAPKIPERYKTQTHLSVGSPKKPSDTLRKGLNFVSKSILDSTDIAVIATDEDGLVLQVNKGARDLFGYEENEFLGLSVHMLVPPHIRAFHKEALSAFVNGDQKEIRMGKRGEITGYKKDGTFFPAEASISKFQVDDDWILVATIMDISARKKAEEDLSWRANHDALTKLPNRALIKERLENALERTARSGFQVGLLFIDLDKFKLVNDTYGHEVGDKLLIKVAKSLSEGVRPGDTVARLGGDEFVVLCENIENQSVLISLAERLKKVLEEPLILDDKELVATASIGLALGHSSTHSVEDLLRESDTAMYASKQQGRNKWHLFSQELHEHTKLRLEIEAGLRGAIEKGETELVYQPIVSARSGDIKGVEALLRWELKGRKISPAIFIPIAEENGTIVNIGRWVFKEACKMQKILSSMYGTNAPYVSINVSTRQLDEDSVVDDFKSIIIEEGADATKILLEITETSIMKNIDKNVNKLNGFRSLGMKVAVDDFGTGYSSFSQLLRLPISHIKIDREFVDSLDKKDDSRLVTTTIIKMAKNLNMKTIAEGAENELQVFELQANGVDYIQGYYFYKPISKDELCRILDNQNFTMPQKGEIYTAMYVSEATKNINEKEIENILAFSRKHNKEYGITGYLIYSEGYFMQLLEGRRDIIESLLLKISQDKRHKNMNTIIKGVVKERIFNDWSMGYRNMDIFNEQFELEELKRKSLTLKDLSLDPKMCYAFFYSMSRNRT